MPAKPKQNESDRRLLRLTPETGAKVEGDVIREYSDPGATGVTASTARGAIEKYLADNSGNLKVGRADVREVDAAEGAATLRIRYQQYVNDLPLFGAVVHAAANVAKAGVVGVTNNVDTAIDSTSVPQPAQARPLDDALAAAASVLAASFDSYRVVDSTLGYLRDDNRPADPRYGVTLIPGPVVAAGTAPDGAVHLVYDLRVETSGPAVVLRVVVDAVTAALMWVESLSRSVAATVRVFSPDPVSESGNTVLGPTSTATQLDGFRHQEQTEVLAAVGGAFRLDGDWVRCLEKDPPTFAQPNEASAAFEYRTYPADRRFLSVNAYFWLDRFARHVRTLGVTTLNTNMVKIDVDAQAVSGADNSDWNPATPPFIRFGEGGVPDAADVGVIIHEYTHGLFDWLGSNHGGSGSYEHSICDALAAIYRDRFNVNGNRRTDTFPFDNVNNLWSTVRSLNRTERFDDAAFGTYGFDLRNSMLGTALWDAYIGMGGESSDANVRAAAGDAMIKTMLEMLLVVPDDTSNGVAHASSMAKGCITADASLTGGLHSKVLDEAFVDRGLWARRAIDVYVTDNPADTGDIPSSVPHWTSPDIWVRNGDPAAGDDPELGHQAPINGVPNYLYVRVHNRGTQAAAANTFTLETFRCDPGTGMIWPTHFTSLGTLTITDPIPAGGAVRVGPFVWTPQIVGHECLLAIVHGADDPAISATLTTPVRHDQLVRFDNNVGQRNVAPQMAVPGGKVKFSLSMRGGQIATTNDWGLDATALPPDTTITIRVPRRVTDPATITGLTTTGTTVQKTELTLTGGDVGRVDTFPLHRDDRVNVEIAIDFSRQATHLGTYPLIATQHQDGQIAGRLTMQITALKDLDDYFFANPRSREIHITTCPFWPALGPASKVPYANLADATARGYNGCAFCLPAADTD
jgi:hypothetical protein